jgi:hypothetical protein
MNRPQHVKPQFVDEIPFDLDEGKLYVSMEYATAVHLCCCGCGSEVVTTLHPKRWTLSYDGEGVSLHPSVGSWSLPCRSHYVIRNNRVVWGPEWSADRIAIARIRDAADIRTHFAADQQPTSGAETDLPERNGFRRLWHWLSHR